MAVNKIEISSEGKYKLNENNLKSILSKAGNCDNFSLISRIEKKNSENSLIINCLVNYLEGTDRRSWPKNCYIKCDEGFQSDPTDKEMNPSIQMWSKPFILKDDDQKTAIFLMDSNNVFTDSTDISNIRHFEEIMGLFLSISSTVIYLKMNKFEQTLKLLLRIT